MTNFTRFIGTVMVLPAVLFMAGCPASGIHPNQLDEFDGKTFDTLFLAHEALTSIRTGIVTRAPQFAPQFDAALHAYLIALEAYTEYRAAPVEDSITLVNHSVSDLSISISELERQFTDVLPVPEPKQIEIRMRMSSKTRSRSIQPRYMLSFADILGALEVAAQIAAQVPQSSAGGNIALLIIHAAQEAEASAQAHASVKIDLNLLMPPLPIGTPSRSVLTH